MEEFRSTDQLARALKERIKDNASLLIGVDGAYGSGKSTLAVALAKELDGVVLRLDDYLLKNGKPYRQQLKYEDIRRDVAANRKKGKPVIVEGNCLLEVMDRIGAKFDVSVYVKKMADDGFWPDEDTCDPEQIDLSSALLMHPGAALAKEVASYHLARDPLSKADFLFVRVEVF